MKTFLLLIAFAPFLVGCSTSDQPPDHKHMIYTCSMHPQVREDRPGNCPICGMKLTPVVADHGAESVAPNASSKNPTVHSTIDVSDSSKRNDGTATVRLGPARDTVASVKTVLVRPGRLSRQIELFGQIQHIFDRQIDFTWYYPGRIQEVLIDFNTVHLEKGTPILKVYSEEAIADEEAYLQALRDRWLATFYERTLLSSKIEAAAARLAKIGFGTGELKLLATKKQIRSDFILKSPISGCLVSPLPHVGERFKADTVLFQVADLKQVWFVADVFEQDLGQLRMGQTVQVTVAAYPGSLFTGKLVYIDPRGDAAKRTVKARFLIDNPKGSLIPELSASAHLTVDSSHEELLIPASAVIDTGTRKIVYVAIAPEQYQTREVVIGMEGQSADSSEGLVGVAAGLRAGESVVSQGAFLIDAEAQLHGSETGPSASKTMPDMPGMQQPH